MPAAQPVPEALEVAPQPAADPSIIRAERRLRKLDELSDKGLAMVKVLPEDGEAQSAESFAKLSRHVRLTITLEEKLDVALAARLSGEIAKCEDPRARPEDPYAFLKTGQRGRVRELVVDVVDHEIPDPEEHDTIVDALDERLLYDEAYRNVDDLPLRNTVERLCEDLKFKPDWRRWTGDGWKPNPPFWRPRCSLFTGPSRTPILGNGSDADQLE